MEIANSIPFIDILNHKRNNNSRFQKELKDQKDEKFQKPNMATVLIIKPNWD